MTTKAIELSKEPGQLAGKVAVITGAGSGVGRAVSVALAEAGARVALIGRSLAPIEATAAVVHQGAGNAIAFPCDVAQESEVDAAITEIVREWKRIDIAVLAAGVGIFGPVDQFSLANWHETMGTNLTGVFLVSRAVIPHLRARVGGAIVAISSGAGKQGYANLAAYSASKFGLMGFMQSLAEELRPDGIRVSTVVPGSILTEFGGKTIEEKKVLMAEGRKYLSPEDVANTILHVLRLPGNAWTQEVNLWPF